MNETCSYGGADKTHLWILAMIMTGIPVRHRKSPQCLWGCRWFAAPRGNLRKYVYPKEDHFVITRAAFAGRQRFFPPTWTAIMWPTWEHYGLHNVQAAKNVYERIFVRRFGYCGICANRPNGELFARWIQIGVFHPFCRVIPVEITVMKSLGPF